MAYSGIFRPKNPAKYVGDHRNIIYRSSWECRVMTWLDTNPDVLHWGSEELAIPYLSPVDGKWHRYFPDMIVKVRTRDNKVKTMMLEIKPDHQTRPPTKNRRVTKQYIQEVATWGINSSKWKAATEYCLDRGWEFKILTEYDLGLSKR